MIDKLSDPSLAAPLFAGLQDTLICSCLQGVMGDVYADDAKNPHSAMAVLDDFAFFAGEISDELVQYKPETHSKDFILMIPPTEAWGQAIVQTYGERVLKLTRYAFEKNPDHLNSEHLQNLVQACPCAFHIHQLDAEAFAQSKTTSWMREWTSNFADFDAYSRLGMGVVIKKDGEIVAGASSYSRYREGIEIQIDTKEAYRRSGLARVCAAQLILDCLASGLYPSWDAANLASANLAQQLGYRFSHEYVAYGIRGY